MALKSVTKLVNPLTADVREVQRLLSNGSLNSVDLVELYIRQIIRHDAKLNAVISTVPSDLLTATAQRLDQERSIGRTRGPLHGIPILVKDNIDTNSDFGVQSTVGSLAFVDSPPSQNARIIEMLVAAGAIVLGKCNLSELGNWKGTNITSGWSAVKGQTYSAYVTGGVKPDYGKDSHWSPSGSSSGSAVAVSAGFAPIALGTETDGSLIVPAGRAALYTIKPTIGLVPQDGIMPISHTFDSAGPLAKTPYDIAVLLDAIADPAVKRTPGSYTDALTASWSDVSVASLDPETWTLPSQWCRPVAEASKQMIREYRTSYEKIKSLAKKFVENVDLADPFDVFDYNGRNSEEAITDADFKKQINGYLQRRQNPVVRTLDELIAFNKKHADRELPPYAPNQEHLTRSNGSNLTAADYTAHLHHLRTVTRKQGIDRILDEHGVDVIVAPSDSLLISYATGSGYPIATLPLSYLKFNGRPFGLAAIARAHEEALLIKVQSAWEATFGPRPLPPALLSVE